MKKALFIGLMALAFPLFSFAAFDTNLKYSASGPEVKELQEFLTDQGVYTGPISGNFYSLTLAGVKAFQTKELISPVSGYFGPLTRAKANAKLDLSASATAEQDETGIVTPAQKSENQKIIDLLALIKAAQDAQTQATQQVAANIGAPIVVVPPPVVELPVQVAFDSPLYAWCGQEFVHATYAGFYCNNVSIGDIFTFSIDGFSPLVETANVVNGSEHSYSFGVEPMSLVPNTEYTYTLKYEHGNKYAIKSGSFKTLEE